MSREDYTKRLIKNRFFPLPTVGAAVYLLVLLGVCVYAIKRNNLPMSIIGTALIFAPAVSIVYAFICFAGVEVCLMTDSPYLKKGEKGNVLLSVNNLLPLPLPALKAALYMPEPDGDGYIRRDIKTKSRLGVTMGGVSRAGAQKSVMYGYCGNFAAECRGISLYDPLGLIRIVSRAQLEIGVAVVPVSGIYTEAVSAKSGDGTDTDRNKRGDDRDEVFDISDYTPGDSLKDIHWKRSAREENLQIIRFAERKNRCRCVLCDMGDYVSDTSGKENPRLRDKVLEVSLGLCSSLMSEGGSVRMSWVGGCEDLGITSTTEQAFVSVCRTLPVLPDGKRIDTETLSGADSVTLVTGAVNEHTVKHIAQIQSECGYIKGISLIVCSDNIEKSVAEKLEQYGTTIHFINKE